MLSNMSALHDVSPDQLRKAANLKERITGLEKELAKLLGSAPEPGGVVDSKPAKKKRRMSAASRANMRAAAKARWAKIKAGKK
jgi:hypothetical protein